MRKSPASQASPASLVSQIEFYFDLNSFGSSDLLDLPDSLDFKFAKNEIFLNNQKRNVSDNNAARAGGKNQPRRKI